MAIQKLTIEEFLELSRQYPVLDVRSPGMHISPAHTAYPYLLMKNEK